MIEILEFENLEEARNLALKRPELEEASVLKFNDGIVLLFKKEDNGGDQNDLS